MGELFCDVGKALRELSCALSGGRNRWRRGDLLRDGDGIAGGCGGGHIDELSQSESHIREIVRVLH